MPYFSVIVPVYNRRDEVEDLLMSLTRQTDKDFEIILVQDGSTERCEERRFAISRSCSIDSPSVSASLAVLDAKRHRETARSSAGDAA